MKRMVNCKQLCTIFILLASCQSQYTSTKGTPSFAAETLAPEAAVTKDKLSMERPLRYKPQGGDFVIENGARRFNRALYGTNSGFRVEAGDLPEFLMYMPRKGGNLKLGIATEKGSKWLIEADYIKAIYRPGTMLYEIKDPLLDQGQLHIQVMAMADAEGMLVSLEKTPGTPDFELIWAYGGASGHRPSRDGDIGADPEEGFYLHPEHCQGNTITLRDNTFRLDYKEKNKAAQIYGVVSPGSSLKTGDAQKQDAPNSLLASAGAALPLVVGSERLSGSQKVYFGLQNGHSAELKTYQELPQAFAEAEAARKKVASQVKLHTPDPYLNTLGGALSIAADAIWDGKSYVHGAIAWRMPLNGWRGAYVADALGWHERARTHFRGYSEAQVTSPASGPVVPDEERNWARQTEELGISLYTNGYISRNPGSKKVAHHYDMNMVFIDELLRHFLWTGDTAYIKEAWPMLERHLAWEKRNFDTDDDGLYDAYASFWASDAVQYSGGGVTHSSAYHYFSNKTAARLASLIGKDPEPFQEEAAKIKSALEANMWMPGKGWYAEYKDLLGRKGLHTSAALWTVYHTLDSEVPDPFQAYQMLRYVDTQIPHIPIRNTHLPNEDLVTLTTTSWMPYTWSVNNVALAEVAHTALAYWQAGNTEKGNRLLRSALMESMYMGSSPGNLQQLSYYDHYRGELYRDFADGIGISSRALVEGMFGLVPDMLAGELLVRPGLPSDWNFASLETPDISYDFRREDSQETYRITPRLGKKLKLKFRAAALRAEVASVRVNGKEVKWTNYTNAVGKPQISIAPELAETYEVVITWKGEELAKPTYSAVAAQEAEQSIDFGKLELLEWKDPQNIVLSSLRSGSQAKVKVAGQEGHHTFFAKVRQGDLSWWQPIDVEIRKPFQILARHDQADDQVKFVLQNNTSTDFERSVTIRTGDYTKKVDLRVAPYSASAPVTIPAAHLLLGTNRVEVSTREGLIASEDITSWNLPLPEKAKGKTLEAVDLAGHYNDKVTQIFRNRYASPRPSSATLQLPLQGIGNWCYPFVTAEIDDAGLRAKAGAEGKLDLGNGLAFSTTGPGSGNNIIFTSQWDNYPQEVSVPLEGSASHVYFLMAGSTNPMQSRFDNGEVLVQYTDGSEERLVLRNPETWWPIEQDYYLNDYSFRIAKPKPIRVHLKTGEVLQDFAYSDIKGFAYNSYIPGGAATVLDLPLNPEKQLQSLQVRALANDVVIGLMGVTLLRDAQSLTFKTGDSNR